MGRVCIWFLNYVNCLICLKTHWTILYYNPPERHTVKQRGNVVQKCKQGQGESNVNKKLRAQISQRNSGKPEIGFFSW